MLRNFTERIYRLHETRYLTLRQTRLRNGPEHYNIKEIEIYDDTEELLRTYFDSTNWYRTSRQTTLRQDPLAL